ncbi:hypothetical protein CC86DRAFT_369918 [Ophiobolus disseminans]|uniref:Uncharacterized protein n=1 Tax=Ophiobolus disseminans TaxID=1469910 RepID=A0A6A7A089_9PLEO|nr:hypothetical protein CC86DRAFT_369918 [Ophiobolus disseminans]
MGLNGCRSEVVPIGLGAALAGSLLFHGSRLLESAHRPWAFVVFGGCGHWRQGPAAGALLLGRIVVGTAAYLLWRSSAKHRLRLPERLLRTDHTAFH